MSGMRENTPSPQGRPGQAILLVLCGLVLLLHATTVRPGHTWWGIDDFTAYLVHGRNLLEGRAYGDIDTVVDPALPPSFQRTAFPPAFSLVVGVVDRVTSGGTLGVAAARERDLEPPDSSAAIDHASPRVTSVLGDDPSRPYGLDILSIKRLLALFTALAVFFSYRAFRPTARPAELLLAAGAFGLSPYLFEFRELVRSEGLFLVLAYGWMALVQSMEAREEAGGKTWGAAVLAGVILALAYSTRTAAVVLPPALIAADVVRRRSWRLRRSTWVVLIVGGACIFAQRAAFASVEGGYVGKLAREWSFATITENISQLAWNYERLWTNGFSTGLQRGVAAFLALLAGVGFFARLRRPTIVEAFTVLYLCMIIVLPTDSAWMRYLLPVLPVFMLSVFTGARVLAGTVPARRTALMGAAAVVILVSYGSAFAHLDQGPLADGMDDPDTIEVFDWVARNTGSDDTIIFKKSRALSLATGRPSIAYPEIFKYGELPDAELWRHFEAVHATAFVMKHSPEEPSNMFRMLSHSDRSFVQRFVENYPNQLVEVFRNSDFSVYEVRGFPRSG